MYDVGDIVMTTIAYHHMMIVGIANNKLGEGEYIVEYIDIDYKTQYGFFFLEDSSVLIQKAKR